MRNFLAYSFSLFLLVSFPSCQSKKETTKPEFRLMTESIYAYAEIVPESFYNTYATNGGIIQEIYVDVGDTISEGQVLMKVTTDRQLINLKNAELAVEKIRENYLGETTLLDNIRKDINTLGKQVIQDSINLLRHENLWKQKIGTLSKLEQVRLQYDLSTNNLETLQKKYSQTEFELKNTHSSYKNLLKKEQSVLQDYFIKSRINGKVYALLKEEGEMISQQEPFAQLGKSNSFIVELQIDEVDIVKIDISQRVLIHLDAYPNEVYEARINKIYPIKEMGTQAFKIDCEFTDAPKTLYAGLSGEANVIIRQKKDVLTIPIDFLIDGNKVRTESGEINVKIGLKNLETVEILSGLDSGTVIEKYISE